jgi:hypothetical protein
MLLAIDGRIAARPLVKNGEAKSEHERSAQKKEQPRSSCRDGHDKCERENRANKVARDHDAAAIHTIEQNARNRPGQHYGSAAGQKNACYGQARSRIRKSEAENSDVVEVVADFAHYLSDPGEPVVAIREKKVEEAVTFHAHSGARNAFLMCSGRIGQ